MHWRMNSPATRWHGWKKHGIGNFGRPFFWGFVATHSYFFEGVFICNKNDDHPRWEYKSLTVGRLRSWPPLPCWTWRPLTLYQLTNHEVGWSTQRCMKKAQPKIFFSVSQITKCLLQVAVVGTSGSAPLVIHSLQFHRLKSRHFWVLKPPIWGRSPEFSW